MAAMIPAQDAPPSPMKSAHAFTALLMIALTSFAGLCQARQDPAAVRSEVTRFLRLQTISLPGEVSVQVGEFAADNALPPCVQLEAFLPPAPAPGAASRWASAASPRAPGRPGCRPKCG
jgi:hypothetical protein